MRFVTIRLGWILTCLLLVVALSYCLTIQHENAHKQICEEFGGNVTNYTITPLLDGSHVICDVSNIDPSLRGYQLLAQANVENFGYQIYVVLVGIIMAVYVLGVLFIKLTES